MKQFFTVAGALYVCFSILCAYSYRGQSASVVADGQDQGSVVVAPDGSHLVGSPMVRGGYAQSARVVVYTTPGCYGCEVFKREGLPALIAEGVFVEVIDASVTPPKDKTIKSYPTIIAYDGDEELKRWTGAAPVSDILASLPKFVEPPEYRIWDFLWWI